MEIRVFLPRHTKTDEFLETIQTKKGGQNFDPRKILGIWLLNRLGVKRAVFGAGAALSSSPSS